MHGKGLLLKNMVMLDTNMILRYLLNDSAEMAEKAEQYIDSGKVIVTVEVIAEVIYVLKRVYALDRDEIVKAIKRFLNLVHFQEFDVLNAALDLYEIRSMDFVDCVLYGYHCARNVQIATFDKKLVKLLNS